MTIKFSRYSGKLYYNKTEHIDISAFILRENEIGFSLASVTQEHGRWEAESGKPAVLQSDGSYLVKNVLATKSNTKASHYWDIVFHIESEEPEQYIEVSGELVEAGIHFKFKGELDAFKG
jgi:hypothetical protein